MDCSCPEHGSWAWAEDGEVRREETFPGKASIHLFTSLAQQQNLYADVILVGVGPGSFNGIRVSVSCALGMALSWKSKVESMRSTDAIAWQLRDKTELNICTPGRQGEFFLAQYAEGKITSEPAVHPLTTLGEIRQAVASHPMNGIGNFIPPKASDLIHYYLAHGGAGLSLQPIHPQQSS